MRIHVPETFLKRWDKWKLPQKIPQNVMFTSKLRQLIFLYNQGPKYGWIGSTLVHFVRCMSCDSWLINGCVHEQHEPNRVTRDLIPNGKYNLAIEKGTNPAWSSKHKTHYSPSHLITLYLLFTSWQTSLDQCIKISVLGGFW